VADTPLAHQFDDVAQQREAAGLGMWTFLATEVLFFGGLFTVYTVYRVKDSAAFVEACHELYMWLGAINTVVLLTSSWTMALGVHAAQHGERRRAVSFLVRTAVLGLVFLLIKGTEYSLDIRERLVPGPGFRAEWTVDPTHAQLFFVLYFVMTGLHAVHMLAGIGVVSAMAFMVWKSRSSTHHANALEMAGLYWHFVDIVWIFLFPLLYLVA